MFKYLSLLGKSHQDLCPRGELHTNHTPPPGDVRRIEAASLGVKALNTVTSVSTETNPPQGNPTNATITNKPQPTQPATEEMITNW